MSPEREVLHERAPAWDPPEEGRARERGLFARIVEENAGEIVLRYDLAARRFDYVSDSALQVAGYAPQEFYAEPGLFRERLAPEDLARLDDMVRSPELARGPVVVRWRRKDGAEVALEWRGTLVLDRGRPVAVEGVARDVTEERAHVEARAALSQARELERLREIDLLKTRIINTAAQEFGTPLTPIKVQLHLLTSRGSANLSEQQMRSLDTIARNVDRLEHLVKDVLDVARLHAGRFPTMKRRVDHARVVEEAVASFEEEARKAGVTLTARVRPGLFVEGDVGRLAQAVFNLVGNAIKFTSAGGRVRVEAERAGELVVTRIEDTGIGVGVEDLSRLFQPFVQLDEAVQLGKPGTGVGLYIARGIVESHGGRIWAESEGAGKGSTFTFTLPASRSESATPGG